MISRSRLWHWLTKIVCLHDLEKTIHSITAKLSGYISLAMIITWLKLGGIFVEKFLVIFFGSKYNSGSFFARSNTLLYTRNGWSDLLEAERGGVSIGNWVNYVTSTYDLMHDLILGFFKVKFWNSDISGFVGVIYVKCKGRKSIIYWADYMTLPFDHTNDIRVWNSLISGLGGLIDAEHKGCEWPCPWPLDDHRNIDSAYHCFMT